MGRLALEIRYKQDSKTKIWYYKLKAMPHFLSTGMKIKREAIVFAERKQKEQENPQASKMLFKDYAAPFFLLGKCPHLTRIIDEGKSAGEQYAAVQRLNLTTHILTSSLCERKLGEIKRGHIVDFRTSLKAKGLAPSTVNKIMAALKTIFNEAEYREHISNNPTHKMNGIVETKEEKAKKERDFILTKAETRKMFMGDWQPIWKYEAAYLCFLLAINTGMRRGEVLALKWKHIDFDTSTIHIAEAWKTKIKVGLPKSGKERWMALAEPLRSKLIDYKARVSTNSGESLVFCYADGSRFGNTWWRTRFSYALEKAGIKDRKLTPHRLRHTLNTNLRASGEDDEKIRAGFGWEDENIQRIYSHLQAEHVQPLGKLIGRMWTEDGCEETTKQT